MDRVIGIPRFGAYSTMMKSFIEGLGLRVIMPAQITRDIIRLGVANSSDMICFPFKVCLGQQIWALENGATDLIMWNNCGVCRQKHYWQLEELILKDLGYKFTMNVIDSKSARKMIRQFARVSLWEMRRQWNDIIKMVEKVEDATYQFSPERKLKVGIVGEVFTMWTDDINFDIVRKLQRMGANVDMSITVAGFLRGKKLKGKDQEREARQYLLQELGGHGFESIANTIWYAKHGFDGVIHLMPLSCMPESTVEPIVDHVANKYSLPLYRFSFDEASFETGFLTRLETFVSMLRRRTPQG